LRARRWPLGDAPVRPPPACPFVAGASLGVPLELVLPVPEPFDGELPSAACPPGGPVAAGFGGGGFGGGGFFCCSVA
jgi:hypothetical protein